MCARVRAYVRGIACLAMLKCDVVNAGVGDEYVALPLAKIRVTNISINVRCVAETAGKCTGPDT